MDDQKWVIFKKGQALSPDEIKDLAAFMEEHNSGNGYEPGVYELNKYSYLMIEVGEDGDVEIL